MSDNTNAQQPEASSYPQYDPAGDPAQGALTADQQSYSYPQQNGQYGYPQQAYPQQGYPQQDPNAGYYDQQGYQQQYGYQQPYYTAPGQGAPNNGAALASMILGIVALVTLFTVILTWVSPFAAIAGVITGHIGLSAIRRTGQAGRGMGITGLVLSYITIGLFVLALIIFFIAMATGGATWLYYLRNF